MGFIEDLGANDLDDVEVVMAFNEAFAVEAPFADAEKIRKLNSMQDVADYIRRLRKGGN